MLQEFRKSRMELVIKKKKIVRPDPFHRIVFQCVVHIRM